MPYVAPEVVQRVKQIDLLTYLKTYEPYELVHFSDKNYSFYIPAEEKCRAVHLFESAIDLLSYATEQS